MYKTENYTNNVVIINKYTLLKYLHAPFNITFFPVKVHRFAVFL